MIANIQLLLVPSSTDLLTPGRPCLIDHLRVLHVLQQLKQRVQTRVRNVLLEVLERPHDRVDNQLEL